MKDRDVLLGATFVALQGSLVLLRIAGIVDLSWWLVLIPIWALVLSAAVMGGLILYAVATAPPTGKHRKMSA
jgi:hypothetical protein